MWYSIDTYTTVLADIKSNIVGSIQSLSNTVINVIYAANEVQIYSIFICLTLTTLCQIMKLHHTITTNYIYQYKHFTFIVKPD